MKVFNNVVKNDSDNTLYFNISSGISGENLTKQQIEDLLGMTLNLFIENHQKYRDAATITINSEDNITQYLRGNTFLLVQETNEITNFRCMIDIQERISQISVCFQFTISFNKQTQEYISGSFITVDNFE